MSRYTGKRDISKTLSAAEHWRQNCLEKDGSVFLNDSGIWILSHFKALEKYFINVTDGGDRNFFEKLEDQLSPVSASVKQLAAEMLWVMFLCPSNMKPETKQEGIKRVWQWSKKDLPKGLEWLDDEVLKGIGSSGTAYNTFRWREFAYVIRLMISFKKQDKDKQESLLSDGWQMAKWLEQIPENETRQFRHMFLFLLFPDNFERIFGGTDRKKIINVYSKISMPKVKGLSALEIDKHLLTIRNEQTKTLNQKDIDFYLPSLKSIWNPDQKSKSSVSNGPAPESTKISNAKNFIFYGPPGTGKTYQMNRLIKEKYQSENNPINKEAWLIQQLLDARWFDAIAAALHNLGGQARVGKIAEHEYILLKARGMGRTKNITQTIWGTLQQHTVGISQTVQYKNRQAPFIFDKGEQSVWRLTKDWQEECADVLNFAQTLEKGPEKKSHQDRYEFITFHQAYSYEDFIEGIRPVLDDESSDLAYQVVPGVFRRIAHKAKADPEQRYALFIDEINRGNIAKIFGELITLIEVDKRADYDNHGMLVSGMELTLPYSGDRFGVPKNLDIFGTMNTADRSIALLDTALRRRFRFKELMPKSGLLTGSNEDGFIEDGEGGSINLRALLDAMNTRIRFLLNRDMTIGHAYFYQVDNFSRLKDIFLNQLIPLLQEYFYEDWHRIQLVFRDVGPSGEKREPQIICHSKILEQDVIGFDHDDYEDLVEYTVVSREGLNPQAIRKIYEEAI